MSRILYSLCQSSCCSQLSLALGLHLPCLPHACIWANGVLALFPSALLKFCILLLNCSAHFLHCMYDQMLCTVSVCVLQHSTDSSLFLILLSALQVAACPLSWLACPWLCCQRVFMWFISSDILSVPSVPRLSGLTLVCVHYLFFMHFFRMLALMISSLSILLIIIL